MSGASSPTKSGPISVCLDDPSLSWDEAIIPDSSPTPAMVRLWSDPAGSMTALVRFPAGWARPHRGYYEVEEQFVVLEGLVVLGTLEVAAGSWCVIPAGCLRDSSVAPEGALALALFSGPPRWRRDIPDPPGPPPTLKSLRSGPGWSFLAPDGRRCLCLAEHELVDLAPKLHYPLQVLWSHPPVWGLAEQPEQLVVMPGLCEMRGDDPKTIVLWERAPGSADAVCRQATRQE